MSDLAEKKIQTFFQKYLKDITQFVDVAKLKAVEQAARMCSIFGQNGSTPEIFAQAIYKEFEQTYNESFNKSNAQPKIEQWINAIFKEYRWNDNKSLFPEKMLDKYPKLKNWNLPYGQNLALADQRTKEFLAKSDYMYLGKYVSGEDTEARMRKWLEQRYIERGIGIGNNPEAIAKFKAEFKELANLEDYKVRRIIDTSVSNTRTFGHLRALSHAGAETLKIAGPNDNLTCPWCRNMVGREFNVKKSVTRMEAAIDAGPKYLPISKPFLTSKYKSDDLKDVDSADIQNLGVELPPYHCSCRHRIVLARIEGESIVDKTKKEKQPETHPPVEKETPVKEETPKESTPSIEPENEEPANKDTRDLINHFEKKIGERGNKTEEAVIIKDGKIVLEKTGTNDQVSFSRSDIKAINDSDVMIHNHPGNSSLSKDDFLFAISNKIKEMRVYTPSSKFGNGSYVFKNIDIPNDKDSANKFYNKVKASERKFLDIEKKKDKDKIIKMTQKQFIEWYKNKTHEHWEIFRKSEEVNKGYKFEYYWISKDGKTRH
ncbi:MAG: hypothetical protein KBA11_08325 [Sedimentibacter sp.]|nr:hypothetical protein [Sedimentibacter sp.]